ncbi:uncharacterized protein V6R79_005116 [Siganus canaliculatus]
MSTDKDAPCSRLTAVSERLIRDKFSCTSVISDAGRPLKATLSTLTSRLWGQAQELQKPHEQDVRLKSELPVTPLSPVRTFQWKAAEFKPVSLLPLAPVAVWTKSIDAVVIPVTRECGAVSLCGRLVRLHRAFAETSIPKSLSGCLQQAWLQDPSVYWS